MNINGISDKAVELALTLWREQLDAGMGYAGEDANPATLDEWLLNRSYDAGTLERAARGDIEALAVVREEAGLPLLV
jgi:hypothetical protein